ncbi:Vacuolar protein sorting-associated protein [Phytophthora fragariae]|uniref:Vacuolar protein sorting-associated protein 35 n=1 Tax=Phytophthora fragariae TaxID=53985 RepID=A0A6A4ADD2_9STRA|nr:Vacuolar protein sorting-associated protein [Phytophthora fragariae]KAE9136117.1 Vacuolar protein sorting-associated protein [Phytophthora fragariae]KAE9154102.1 Vacuolar protein sorting-associated protein [Phytophthora fragariae]KAE9199708.1 Vacuolar protein sorting-associated protein [Phytophthora fragariae]KAE9254965.1 Vacuolar protein sorting-associated protein [Phytophthora fragariae]
MALGGFVLDEQGEEDLLREALQTVRDQGFRMQRAADAGDQPAVLKHAAEVLRELRTSLLTPKKYYQLYMQVLDELRHLESYVEEQQQAGASMRELYERVQSSGNVLPRLYLLVTVGSVYIKSKEAQARDVLTDLVEMTKGVQYPLRGLFLRHYLSLSVRDKLPDTGSIYEQAGGGSVSDAIDFLLQNLRETNQLWIRLQHQKTGGSRPLAVREKERMELRLLVGTSLVRLSQMDGVTRSVYTEQVLPRLLDDVVLACKDSMAQQYLMDCIIQVFPDEFHLQNLERLLHAVEKLHPNVDVALILTALLERLTKFREAQGSVTNAGQQVEVDERDKLGRGEHEGLEVFQQVMNTTTKLLLRSSRYVAGSGEAPSQGESGDVHLASVLQFFVTFATFTLAWMGSSKNKTPDATAALQQLVSGCLTFLRERTAWRVDKDKQTRQLVVSQLESLALTLLRALSIEDLMHVPVLRELLALMPWQGAWKDVALAWIRVLLARHERVHNEKQMDFLLQVLAPLVRDDPNELPSPPPATTVEAGKNKSAEIFEAEQQTLAKVVQLVSNDDLDVKFRVFSVARRAFLQSGVFRIRFTLVPLIYQSLTLARDLAAHSQEKTQTECQETKTDTETTGSSGSSKTFVTTPREVLQFVHEMVTALASKQDALSVSCVHLFLQCALVADGCAFEAVAYEFITQAFIVYEDQITLAREQWRALELMVASLRATRNLSTPNYEVLATKTTQYAARLLKKNEQALMVLNCAHLFWHPSQQDGKRVRECLQRSLRIADAIKDTTSNQVPLFLEILEAYLYFFEMQTPEVTRNYLVGLLALVKDHLDNMEHGQMRREGEFRYRAIVRYMDALDISDDAVSTSSSSSSRLGVPLSFECVIDPSFKGISSLMGLASVSVDADHVSINGRTSRSIACHTSFAAPSHPTCNSTSTDGSRSKLCMRLPPACAARACLSFPEQRNSLSRPRNTELSP